MALTQADSIRLRIGRDDIIYRSVSAAHVAEIDAALEEVHADFVAEQVLGEDVLAKHWRAWTVSHLQADTIAEVKRLAEAVRSDFDVLLLLGVGGSDLAPRVIHETLDDPLHNRLSKAQRGGGLEVHFAGDTFDPRRLNAILRTLHGEGKVSRTVVNIVSRSGKTAETFAASLLVREALRRAKVRDWQKHVIATTLYSENSLLYQDRKRFYGLLPVPEGVGGRFSAASPVGLLPLALAANKGRLGPGERIDAGLEGFERGHEQAFGLKARNRANIAFQLGKWLHLAEQCLHRNVLLFYNYGDDRYLGDWLTQLYSESIQERGEGLNLLATRGPTGNHSILNGVIRGPRDKVVVFVKWGDLGCGDVRVPGSTGLTGDLADLGGLPMESIQDASLAGVAAAFAANGVPNATLEVPRRDEGCLFQLMRILMDAVAVKGRLQGLHLTAGGAPNAARDLTYQQDGVEEAKEGMRKELKRTRRRRGLK
jgi:glucose-6-phosphate isomerase